MDNVQEVQQPEETALTEPEVLPSEDPTQTDDEWIKDELPEEVQKFLAALIREAAGQEMYDRRREILRDRRNRYYERGYQHIFENQRGGYFTQGAPGAVVTGTDGEQFNCPTHMRDYNIFGPFVHILESVHTQNEPGIIFKPKDPNKSADIDAAKNSDGYKEIIKRQNDMKGIQTQIVRMMLLSGRTVSYCDYEKNPKRNGQLNLPEKIETPRIYGTIESKVPITAKCLEACWYIMLYDDPDIKMARYEYPWRADKIQPGAKGIGENEYERISRLGILQGNKSRSEAGNTLTHLVSRVTVFLDPCAWSDPDVKDMEIAGQGSVKEFMDANFPDGICSVFVGEEYIQCKPANKFDHIDIRFPYKGDGMSRQAVMDDMIPVQDDFNDMINAAAEVWDYGWPSTFINAQGEEFDSIMEQKADPFSFRPFKMRDGNAMEANFYREPMPELPQSFLEYLNIIQASLPQFILSAPPALFGSSDDAAKTASGYAQARNQAMGAQSIIWQEVQGMFSTIYFQCALLAAKNPAYDDNIVVPNGKSTQTVTLQKITDGNFGCYPDEDSSFPESTMQKRQTLTQLVAMAAQSPLGASIFEEPKNWELLKFAFGVDELVIKQSEAATKQAFEIEILLQQPPIQPAPEEVMAAQVQHAAASIAGQQTGQPVPPFDPASLLKPSVMPMEFDYHQFEFEYCKAWLSSDACRREIAGGNTLGVQNVTLHAKAHQQMAAMEMMQQMALQAPPPQGGQPGQGPQHAPPGEKGSKQPAPPPPAPNPNSHPGSAQGSVPKPVIA